MSNQIKTNPLSLVEIAASFAITHKLQDASTDEHIRSQSNAIVKNVWDKLKSSAAGFDLEQIVYNIEATLWKKCPENITQKEQEKCVESQVNHLFDQLAEKFQSKRAHEQVPVDFSTYLHLQQPLENNALQTIWNTRLSPLFRLGNPRPSTLEEIKAWLKDPVNANRVNSIDKLDLSGLNLNTLPAEITLLAGLTELHLSNNPLQQVSHYLSHLPQLTILEMNNVQIHYIPPSICKMKQLQWLSLTNNRICIIPDFLTQLNHLRRLSLDHNEIAQIPDSLAELKTLQGVFLTHNKISEIPTSLKDLHSLIKLCLDHNQIKSVPEDAVIALAKQQLNWLSLKNNPITTVSKSLASLELLKLDDSVSKN
jgi:Leucine-rich repeat (LRR) protein